MIQKPAVDLCSGMLGFAGNHNGLLSFTHRPALKYASTARQFRPLLP